MNYKIAKTMLVLCVVYLIVFYILKFIFPELLLQTITSNELLNLGKVVNSWKGFEVIFNFLFTFITLYLFSCASSGVFKKTKKELLSLIILVFVSALFYYLLPNLYTHASTSIILWVAVLCKGKLYYTTISFSIHGFLSQFLFSIRGFETIITYLNEIGFLASFLLSIEGFLWLILLSIIFYFKENKQNGNDVAPVS